MRIERRKDDRRADADFRSELGQVANAPAPTGRVCDASCEAVCPTCGSTGCACACSKDCQYIPELLTNDSNFPVEQKIAPLAFELKRLGIFEPCWSCEGHKDSEGLLWKIPRVWFYCHSIVYLRLLSDVMKDLEIEKKLNVPWQVCVTFSDADNPDTTFSLEPARIDNTSLESLQADTTVITASVYDRVTAKAGVILNNN